MFRKFLITFLMGMLILSAAVAGTSFPVLLLMGSLLLIAIFETSSRQEHDEPQD
jgi:hypothetical protein